MIICEKSINLHPQKIDVMLEIIGAVFITIAGALGHFIYGWSRHDSVAAEFFSVNESTWEHIKLAIYPSLIWFFVNLYFYSGNPNLLPAQAACMLTMILLIPGLFYAYTAITRKNFLPVDIICFAASVFAGMHVFNRIINATVLTGATAVVLQWSSILILIAILIAYLTLSYHPFHNFLFMDPITNEYGITGHRCNNTEGHQHSHGHNHAHGHSEKKGKAAIRNTEKTPADAEAENLEFLRNADKIYLVAMKEELDSAVTDTPVVYTGVGKARASRALLSYLSSHRPRFTAHDTPVIVSIGTAGSGKHHKGDIILVDNFANNGDAFIKETISFDTFPNPTGHICASSDFFVGPENFSAEKIAEFRGSFDCMDMESFALANICAQFGLKFCAVKCISDGADNVVSNFDKELPIFREKLNDFVKGLDR